MEELLKEADRFLSFDIEEKALLQREAVAVVSQGLDECGWKLMGEKRYNFLDDFICCKCMCR